MRPPRSSPTTCRPSTTARTRPPSHDGPDGCESPGVTSSTSTAAMLVAGRQAEREPMSESGYEYFDVQNCTREDAIRRGDYYLNRLRDCNSRNELLKGDHQALRIEHAKLHDAHGDLK